MQRDGELDHAKAGAARRNEPMQPAWYEQPVYYKGNHREVLGPGDLLPWPSYTRKLDFEFEVAAVVGLGEATPLAARLYRFRNDDSYTRLRSSVDACAAEWITDPTGLLMIDASPYVLVMEGATDQAFIDALRTSLNEAAGN